MALTLVFALIGALFFALFVVPVLATFLFRRGYRGWENPLLRWFRPIYAAILRGCCDARWLVAVGARVAARRRSMACVVPRLGIEFLPYMDEGVIWVRANFPEGTSLEQTAQFGERMREIVLRVPGHRVRLRAGGPQRQRHRSVSAQPHGNHDRPEAARRSGRSSAPSTSWSPRSASGCATSFPRRASTSRSRSSTASPRTPTARRPTWPSSSPGRTRTCCCDWRGRRSTLLAACPGRST